MWAKRSITGSVAVSTTYCAMRSSRARRRPSPHPPDENAGAQLRDRRDESECPSTRPSNSRKRPRRHVIHEKTSASTNSGPGELLPASHLVQGRKQAINLLGRTPHDRRGQNGGTLGPGRRSRHCYMWGRARARPSLPPSSRSTTPTMRFCSSSPCKSFHPATLTLAARARSDSPDSSHGATLGRYGPHR
jgi:hypothetical protein